MNQLPRPVGRPIAARETLAANLPEVSWRHEEADLHLYTHEQKLRREFLSVQRRCVIARTSVCRIGRVERDEGASPSARR